MVSVVLYLLAVWLVLSSLWRARRARRKFLQDQPAPILNVRVRSVLPAALNFLAALLISITISLAGALFFRGPELIALYVLAGAIMFGSLIDLTVAVTAQPHPASSLKKLSAPLLAVLVASAMLSFVLFLRSVPGPLADAVHLQYPVRGRWRAATGGRTALTNYHHGNPTAQNYAVDLVYEEGESEGQPVYAPVEGIVIEAVNDPGPGGPAAEGNLIIIQSADRVEIWLAHLKQGSVLVEKNDRITTGEKLAEVGATGAAARPHLHIHAQRLDQPVAILFGTDHNFLLRNEVFESP